MSPRLHPINFYENLRRSPSPIYRRKNLKKFRRKATVCGLESAEFHRYISNLFRYPPHSSKSSEKNWGRPSSPAPVQKNLENISGVGIDNMLKSTEFRRFASNRFRNIRLSSFWEFPTFSKSVK